MFFVAPTANNNVFQAAYCNCQAAWGLPGFDPAVQNGTATCIAQCGDPSTYRPPSPHFNTSWNVDPVGGGHGDGVFGHWFFDREGLMQTSFDGRFVSLPAYVSPPGRKLKLGTWYEPNPTIYASDGASYDDKTLVILRWDGVVDTKTFLTGSQIFLGAILPDEPQYCILASLRKISFSARVAVVILADFLSRNPRR